RLADQALLWVGKAQIGAGDPNNQAQFEQSVRAGIETLRKAADRAQASQDADAKVRRAEILMEMADAQQSIKQYREAASVYQNLLNDKTLPEREEELLERQVTSLHLAGDYAASDAAAQRFQKDHPRSPLLPVVLFRHGENAYFLLLAAEKLPPAD